MHVRPACWRVARACGGSAVPRLKGVGAHTLPHAACVRARPRRWSPFRPPVGGRRSPPGCVAGPVGLGSAGTSKAPSKEESLRWWALLLRVCCTQRGLNSFAPGSCRPHKAPSLEGAGCPSGQTEGAGGDPLRIASNTAFPMLGGQCCFCVEKGLGFEWHPHPPTAGGYAP